MTLILNGDDGITFPDSSVQAAAGLTSGYTAKAWVNFNGQGTISVLASQNISSLTDNGTGDYSNNFSTLLPTASFVATGTAAGQWHQVYRYYLDTAKTTSQYRLKVLNAAGSAYYDSNDIMMAYNA